MINKIYLHKAMELLKVIPLIIILGFYVNQNLKDFFNPSRDQDTYLKAVTEFIEGKNPYVWTILTYSNQEEYESELGYAYLSGFLFLLSPIYIFSVISNLSFEFLSKIPVLISDFLIGFLIYQKIYKHNYFAAIFGFFIWFVNPFFLIRGSYTHNDQIPTFFMLLSLIYLNKDSVKSGAFFALSILFKTFALVLFPIYLLLTKNKKDFILSGAIIGLFFSLPFMGSFENFYNYIYGSLFVHGSREIQGRPFLFYFSYWSDIEIFQIIPVSIYSFLAMFGSWAVILISYFFLKIKDKYLLGSIAALNFYLFTPVLNRTYLLWFFPLIIFGAFSLGRTKKMYFYYSVLVFYLAFYYFYLKDWGLGFHEVIPF